MDEYYKKLSCFTVREDPSAKMSENEKMFGVVWKFLSLNSASSKEIKRFQERYCFPVSVDFDENDIYFDLNEKNIGKFSLFYQHSPGYMVVYLLGYEFPNYDETNLTISMSRLKDISYNFEYMFFKETELSVPDKDDFSVFSITWYNGVEMGNIFRE